MSFLTSRRLFSTLSLALVASLSAPLTAFAHGDKVGDIEIKHPYARPTLTGQVNGGVFFMGMHNQGKTSDYLVSAKVDPSVAKSTELHRMSMEGDVMKMKQVVNVELPANKMTEFKHGSMDGYHVMLMGVNKPLKVGDKFKLTLQFKNSGSKEVEVWVEIPKAGAEASSMHSH